MLLNGKVTAGHGAQQPCLHERIPCPRDSAPQVLPLEQSYPRTRNNSRGFIRRLLAHQIYLPARPSILFSGVLRRNTDFGGKLPRKLNKIYFVHRKWSIGWGTRD
jgi:hypothetical protein